MEISVDFDDVNSPRTADHDDIDFDMNTPRDITSVDLSNDLGTAAKNNSEIPSIVITEPSSANLADLVVGVPELETEKDDDTPEAGTTPDTCNEDIDIQVDQDTVTSGAEERSVDVDLETTVTIDKVISAQDEESKASENEEKEVTEITTTTVKQDIETEVNFANIEKGADVDVVKRETQDDVTDPLVPANNEAEDASNEVEHAVSLDNIMMKDKAETDSDEEFDFDLTPAPRPPHQLPESSQPQSAISEKLEADTQAEVPVSVVAAAPPASKETQGPAAGFPLPLASNSVITQRPVPASCNDYQTGFPSPQGSGSSTQKPVAVIKPTSQAPYIVQPPPDEGTQQVLEAAQAEWDKVTTIQAGYDKAANTSVQGAEPTVIQTVESMSPHELLQIFRQEDFSAVRTGIKPSVDRHGFSAFVNFLFGPPKLHRELIPERDTVFCIAASQLSNDNSSHIRTLQTIYRCLTGSKFDCPRIGSHWEEIGFQGTDPATDLRGAGLLGLMNLLHILKDNKKYQLASDIYRLSLHPTQNFPFCIMGINLSRITLQTLREGLLNKECNRRHEVISVVNDFYAGLYLQLYKVWKGQGKTISDSGFVIKDIDMKAKKSPRDVFRTLDDYLNKKSVVVRQKSTDSGGDNFINVCDDTT